ncbi:MAG: hypothetical protein U0R17_07255 [Acidimicrobiia bacterium]
MNNEANFVNAFMIVMGQINSIKEKVDPEVYELLGQSAKDAISSAHRFLDACEKVIESLEKDQDEIKSDVENDNIVNLSKREA